MILDVDIGNTRLKWVLRNENGKMVDRGHASSHRWTQRTIDVDRSLSRVRVSSVKGDLNRQLEDWAGSRWGIVPEYARVVDGTAGLVCSYREPARLGVDRWLAMLACWQNIGRPALVVDAGSALTIDVLGEEGHRGGYIIPGLAMMKRALAGNTWGVKAESLESATEMPGDHTAAAVNNGCLVAMAGAVTRAAELAAVSRIVATGGDAPRLVSILAAEFEIKEVPDLVIDGLAVAMP